MLIPTFKVDTTKPNNGKSQQRRKIKLNILLTIILVPASLLFLILIILILWLIKNKIERDNKKKQAQSTSSVFPKDSHISLENESIICCCYSTPTSNFISFLQSKSTSVTIIININKVILLQVTSTL